jgi:hypothetical protein
MRQSICTTLQLTLHHLKRVSLLGTEKVPAHKSSIISPSSETDQDLNVRQDGVV